MKARISRFGAAAAVMGILLSPIPAAGQAAVVDGGADVGGPEAILGTAGPADPLIDSPVSASVPPGTPLSSIFELKTVKEALAPRHVNFVFRDDAGSVELPAMEVRNVSLRSLIETIERVAAVTAQVIEAENAELAPIVIFFPSSSRGAMISSAPPALAAPTMTYRPENVPPRPNQSADPFGGDAGVGSGPSGFGGGGLSGSPTFRAPVMDDSAEMQWVPFQSGAQSERVTRTYGLADLVDDPSADLTADAIVEAIRTVWDAADASRRGNGAPSAGRDPAIALHEKTRLLIVTATPELQQTVAEVLENLRRHNLRRHQPAGSLPGNLPGGAGAGNHPSEGGATPSRLPAR